MPKLYKLLRKINKTCKSYNSFYKLHESFYQEPSKLNFINVQKKQKIFTTKVNIALLASRTSDRGKHILELDLSYF